jgi:hypothetical protein
MRMGFLDKLRRPAVGSQETDSTPRRDGIWSVPVTITVSRATRFAFLETVDYDGDADDAQRLSFDLAQRRTMGRYILWRDDRDQVVYDDQLAGSGGLLPQKDVAYHRPSGLVAAAGFGRPEFYADESVHEWREFLWIQAPDDRCFARIEAEGDAWSLDISPDGSHVAALWWTGAEGAVCRVVNVASRAVVMQLPLRKADGGNLYGGEELRFSPDGQWIVLTTPLDDNFVALIETASGRRASIPCPGVRSAGWWPTRDPSTLLVTWFSHTGTNELGALDCRTGLLDPLGAISAPPEYREPFDYPFGVERITVSADGRALIGQTTLAKGDEIGRSRNPRTRVTRGILVDDQPGVAARFDSIPAAFIGSTGGAVVEQNRARWIEESVQGRCEVGAAFLSDTANVDT